MRRSANSTRGLATSDVATGGRRNAAYRKAVVTAIVTAGISLSLSGCSTIATSAACSKNTGALVKSPALTLAKGVSSTTLPPSRDNDAGRARASDATPDADVDASQRPRSCAGPK